MSEASERNDASVNGTSDVSSAPINRRRRAMLIGAGVAFALVVLVAARSIGGDDEKTGTDGATTTAESEPQATPGDPSTSPNGGSSTTAGSSTTGGSQPGTTPSVVPPTAAEGPLTEAEAREGSETALRSFLRVADEIFEAGGDDAAPINPLAVEPSRGEVQARAAELESNEWSQDGTVEVVGLDFTSVDVTAATPVVQIQACLDDTDVVTVDKTGRPLQPPSGETRRIAHLYSVQLVDGAWLVAEHTFPDESTC